MKWTIFTTLMISLATTMGASESHDSRPAASLDTVHAVVTLNQAQLAALSDALHHDKWDRLLACFPTLARGENPFLDHPDYEITVGELVILMRGWDCLKNMLRSGLRANEAMIQMSGEMGSSRIYAQLLKSNPIMTSKQTLRFSGTLLELALENGGDPNARSREESKRPLMTHTELDDIKLLIKHGADVNAVDAVGRSALFYHTDKDILSYLIKHGADVNLLDEQGYSALDYWKENKSRFELLSKAGGKAVKPMKLIKMGYHDGYEVILNDMDDYAYMVVNEKEQETDPDQIVFYLASRFPTPHVRQTENWHEFIKWLRALPAYSTLHRYVQGEHHFASEKDWVRPYMLDKIIAPIPLSEGVERVYFVNNERDDIAKGLTVKE